MGRGRVDLDAVQAWLAAGPTKTTAREGALRRDALAAVAELRAAREVVTAATKFWDTFGDECASPICDDLAHALNGYEADGEPT